MSQGNRNSCSLCETRKAKRYCPARSAQICPACCGSKREVEIDCPSGCPYLLSGRDYESQKGRQSGTVFARTARLWDPSFIRAHSGIFLVMWEALLKEREQLPEMVDTDLQAALECLIQTYQTLEKGIYYESLPSVPVQRSLYLALKEGFESSSEQVNSTHLTPSAILDCLTFHKELGQSFTLPRPRSRAFLDHIEESYYAMVPVKSSESNLILP